MGKKKFFIVLQKQFVYDQQYTNEASYSVKESW